MKLSQKAKQLKKDIPAVYLCLKSKDTPLAAKILAGITVGYALSPIDLIPDFIPVLGYLDDLIILPLLVTLTIRLIPEQIFERCRKHAEEMWQTERPRKWFYAIPVVLVWLLIIWLVVKAVWIK